MRRFRFLLTWVALISLGYTLGSLRVADPGIVLAQTGASGKAAEGSGKGARSSPADAGAVDATGVAPAPSAVQQIDVPDDLQPLYANFARVTGSPEEVIVDLGLNPQGHNVAVHVRISQRLVMNYFTAKRLWGALTLALQRHEQTFGVIETDASKRVTGQR